jgi:UDP-3-O-acyl-N-acetylglucosamine deacetylase
MVMQAAKRECIAIDRRIRVGTPSNWVEATPSRDPGLTVEYRLDYGVESPIGQQTYSTELSPEIFCRELAGARTFVTAAQVAELKSKGIGNGVNQNDLLIFDDHGLVSGALRWPDECSRHKALDIVGDLALLGADLRGKITSFRGGHRLNAALARELREQITASNVCRRAA